MHALLHKSRRENDRRVVFPQQDMIYSHAHLVLTNFLITSLLVLCFSQWFLLFLPPKFLLIPCHPIDSYSDICYLGTDELIIFVSSLWMIWVDLPFLIYLSIAIHSSEAGGAHRQGRLAICHVIRYPRVQTHQCVVRSGVWKKWFAIYREMVSNRNVGATTYTVCWVGTDRGAAPAEGQ